MKRKSRRRGGDDIILYKQPVLILGSIHLSLMGAIGIWLWHKPLGFGKPLNSCDPMLVIAGVSARFSSQGLHIFSWIMYIILLIPGLNLILPFLLFLNLHIFYNQFYSFWATIMQCLAVPQPVRKAFLLSCKWLWEYALLPFWNRIRLFCSWGWDNILWPILNLFKQHSKGPHNGPTIIHTGGLIGGLGVLFMINILLIVSIELTIRRNQSNQTGEDNEWGFGQVLALLLLVVPLRDAWNALLEATEKLKSAQRQFEDIILRECQATPVDKELEHLLDEGANITAWSGDSGWGSALQVAAYYGKLELVKWLQKHGVQDRDMPSSKLYNLLSHVYSLNHHQVVDMKQHYK
jgi:hypothetical protein